MKYFFIKVFGNTTVINVWNIDWIWANQNFIEVRSFIHSLIWPPSVTEDQKSSQLSILTSCPGNKGERSSWIIQCFRTLKSCWLDKQSYRNIARMLGYVWWALTMSVNNPCESHYANFSGFFSDSLFNQGFRRINSGCFDGLFASTDGEKNNSTKWQWDPRRWEEAKPKYRTTCY